MVNISKFLLLFVFVVVLMKVISAQTINPNEYLDEFNNLGENCTIQDSFFYTDSGNVLSFISVYNCCDKNSCIQLPFDVDNRRELSGSDLQESFNIAFTREAIKSNKLVPSNYFPDSVDVCAYFSDKLPEQSRNLAVETSDRVVKYTPQNYQKIYRLLKEGGLATGFISEFNIGVFIVGVGCNGLSKQESNAFFKVGECYNNLQSIESGATYYGISSQTYNCMQEADGLLKEVISSTGQQIRGALNKVGNAAVGFWNFGKDLMKGNLSAKVDIKETTYEAAQRVDGKVNIEKTYLENPSALTLSGRAQNRFWEKRNSAMGEYSYLSFIYANISNRVPSSFTEFVKNIFYSPNVNYNDSRFYLDNAVYNLDKMNRLIGISGYNSAMSLNSSISEDLNKSITLYQSKSEIDTKFDYMSLVWGIIIIVALIWIVYKLINYAGG